MSVGKARIPPALRERISEQAAHRCGYCLCPQELLGISDGSRIIGVTACGRATCAALRLNNPDIIVARRLWVAAGWWPPRS